VDWLAGIRRNTFAPIIVLSNSPEKDMSRMIQSGADICISSKWPCSVIADLTYAQLRRYTEYNRYNNPDGAAASAFQIGDIFIAPALPSRRKTGGGGAFLYVRHHATSEKRIWNQYTTQVQKWQSPKIQGLKMPDGSHKSPGILTVIQNLRCPSFYR